MRVQRLTVDLTEYPDLVVIYLGLRVNRLRGLRRLRELGPQISRSAAERPNGLLNHEMLLYSAFPLHVGMRQYWRDLDSLEAWTRSDPHRSWWRDFLRDTGGTGFWHETYLMRGGMEAIYDDIPQQRGLAAFAPGLPAVGQQFSARGRAGDRTPSPRPVIEETELA